MSISFAARDIFDWLDREGDGNLTPEELAEMLELPVPESEELILNAQLALFGESKGEGTGLTKEEFTNLMRDPNPEATVIISRNMAERYATVFESLDQDKDGAISVKELGLAIGLDDEDDLSSFMTTVDQEHVGFADFVALLRQSETARAAISILEALEQKNQGQKLIAAFSAKEKQGEQKNAHKYALSDGTTLEDFLKIRAARQSRSSLAPVFDPAFRKVSVEPYFQVTDITAEVLHELWAQCELNDKGRAAIDDLRCVLMMAQSTNELSITDADLLDMVLKLNDVGNDGDVTFEQFAECMEAFICQNPAMIRRASTVNNSFRMERFHSRPPSFAMTRGDKLVAPIPEMEGGHDLDDEDDEPRMRTAAAGLSAAAYLNRQGSTFTTGSSDEDDDCDSALPPLCPVVLYTSSIKVNHNSEANERRLRHILETKGIDFELVYLDEEANTHLKGPMAQISGTTELPQLHIGGKYYGSYLELHEMEDAGTFDGLFESEGISVKKKPPAPTPRQEIRNTASCEGMTVHMTAKFAVVRWDPSQIHTPAHEGELVWLLTMDGEPVYVGPANSYVVTNPNANSHHHFELQVLDQNDNILALPNGDKVLSELSIVAPSIPAPEPAPFAMVGRLLSTIQATPRLAPARTPQPHPQPAMNRYLTPQRRDSLVRPTTPFVVVTAPAVSDNSVMGPPRLIPATANKPKALSPVGTPRNVRGSVQNYTAPSLFMSRGRDTPNPVINANVGRSIPEFSDSESDSDQEEVRLPLP
eukprot:c8658_g1_i1.p1 GENE.c8658_g1_i1~~c8658_g1_i1.p1  ORF type:complete len:794 (-),score=261.51 c8658_g1_i1:64-2343(-)